MATYLTPLDLQVMEDLHFLGFDPLDVIDDKVVDLRKTLSLSKDAYGLDIDVVEAEVHPFVISCDAMRRTRQKYPGEFV